MIQEKYFHFPSADGKTQISVKTWCKEEKPRAILQIAHGMVEHKERYDRFARYMASQGFFVCANDHLGHGDSVLSTDLWGYMTVHRPLDVLLEDMNRLRLGAQKKYPDLPCFFLGHSMGSYLLRCYLARYGEGLSGAIVMGTGYEGILVPAFALALIHGMAAAKGWHFRSTDLQNMSYGKPYRQYDLTGKDPGNSWLTKDTSIVEKYYQDPKCTYVFTLSGYKALMEAVLESALPSGIRRIPRQLPILLISGAKDPVGNLGQGVRAVYGLYRKAGLCNTDLCLYEEDRHEVLNETDYETVYADLLAWCEKCLEKEEESRKIFG